VLYVLFFIELSTRKVHIAGCTANPDGAWVTQQARNLSFHLETRKEPLKFLIHDRDKKFCGPFDDIFATEGVQVIRTPIQAPRANAIAERWVRTVREECLDWLLITGRRHLEAVVGGYVRHYNDARPHRGLDLCVPNQPTEAASDRQPAGAVGRKQDTRRRIHDRAQATRWPGRARRGRDSRCRTGHGCRSRPSGARTSTRLGGAAERQDPQRSPDPKRSRRPAT
jgi:hypothetical protein